MTLHRCAESQCPYLDTPSPKSCACHKTDEQVLWGRLEEAYREGHADASRFAIDEDSAWDTSKTAAFVLACKPLVGAAR